MTVRALFVNTPIAAPLGADTWVHLQVARDVPRSDVEPYLACVKSDGTTLTATYQAAAQMADLHIVPVNFGSELGEEGFAHRLLELRKSLRAPWHIAKLAQLVRRDHIQVLYTSDRLRDAWPCLVIGRICKVPTVIHLHVNHGAWIGRPLLASLRKAHRLIAISEFTKQSYVEAGFDARIIDVVHNGVPADRWGNDDQRSVTRSEFVTDDETVLILCVARLFPPKGVGELVDAVGELAPRHPNVKLLIAGLEVEQGFRAHLEQRAARSGAASMVHFLGHRSDVPQLMAAADIYAMPSFEEPFGLVFVEAMLSSLPVVALDSGGAREIIVHQQTGLLSAPNEHRQLIDNLETLIASPAMRTTLGAAGRQRALEHFSSTRMAAEVGAVLTAVSSQGWNRR
jgi:glycosyltransferase involved in cell wall biosynthesis